MFRHVRWVAPLLAVLAVTAGYRVTVWACAVAPHEFQRVRIHEEQALIVWDAEAKIEHFIRQATFHTSDPKFGFLVPTPTQPTLAESDQDVFKALENLTRPRIIYTTVKKPRPAPQRSDGRVKSAPTASAPRSVEVLERTTVAGFDAAVLKATDVAALEDWLTTNEFAFRPALREWVKKYTDDGWIITAFKLSGGAPGQTRMNAIRMSFAAEQPFYPYREPVEEVDPKKAPETTVPRLLKLFVLSNERVEATLGAEGERWHAQTEWANKVTSAHIDQAMPSVRYRKGQDTATSGVPEIKARESWYLTEFADHASPRPATDELYFRTLPNAATVERPPIHKQQVEYYDPPLLTVEGATSYRGRSLLMLAGGILFGLGVCTAIVLGIRRRPKGKG
jgi:hypothetical protein